MSAAIEVTQLPDDVREKLAELELELSEGKQTLHLNNPLDDGSF